jgi:hydrogenase-4 component E
MITLTLWNQLFTAGLLLFSLVLIGKPRLPAIIRHFALASLCLAGLTVTASLLRGDEHGIYGAVGTFTFKVVFIPLILAYAARRAHASMQVKFYLRPAATYFVVALVLLVSYLASARFEAVPFVSVALVLLGLTYMIMRKDLYSQIIGFMVMENGVASYGIITVGGIPLLIEIGIFLTVTAGALVMAILSRHVQEMYATGDTERLTELTE